MIIIDTDTDSDTGTDSDSDSDFDSDFDFDFDFDFSLPLSSANVTPGRSPPLRREHTRLSYSEKVPDVAGPPLPSPGPWPRQVDLSKEEFLPHWLIARQLSTWIVRL